MIDPATGWFEIKQIANKEAHTVAEAVEQTWLSRYPWPTQVILDRGTEFMGEFSRMIKEDYGLRKKPITARNPQANSIIERVHQTVGQMLRTFRVQDTEDLVNPLDGILAAISFALRTTVESVTFISCFQPLNMGVCAMSQVLLSDVKELNLLLWLQGMS